MQQVMDKKSFQVSLIPTNDPELLEYFMTVPKGLSNIRAKDLMRDGLKYREMQNKVANESLSIHGNSSKKLGSGTLISEL